MSMLNNIVGYWAYIRGFIFGGLIFGWAYIRVGLYSGGAYIWNEVSVSICGGLIFGGGLILLILEVTIARKVLPHPQGIKGSIE